MEKFHPVYSNIFRSNWATRRDPIDWVIKINNTSIKAMAHNGGLVIGQDTAPLRILQASIKVALGFKE